MSLVVVDTNVGITANGDADVDLACQLACVERLERTMTSGVVAVDDAGRIFDEYRRHFQLLWCAGSWAHVLQTSIGLGTGDPVRSRDATLPNRHRPLGGARVPACGVRGTSVEGHARLRPTPRLSKHERRAASRTFRSVRRVVTYGLALRL